MASGTVALVFILRRQIRMSVEDLQATTMRIEELDPTSPSLSGRERSRGWRSQVRKAARGGEVEGIGSEQAKRIEGLRKVEQERIIVSRLSHRVVPRLTELPPKQICGVMFTFSILIFTLIIYTLVTLRQLGANNWPSESPGAAGAPHPSSADVHSALQGPNLRSLSPSGSSAW